MGGRATGHPPLLLLTEEAEVAIKHRKRKVIAIAIEGEDFLLREYVASMEECSFDRLCKLFTILSSCLSCE